MKTFSKTTTLLTLLGLLSFSKLWAQPCMEVVGYFPSWQWYDRNQLVNPQTIDYSQYSILNYCFFKPEADGSISSHDAWADENLLLGTPDWQNGGYIPGTSIVSQAHSNGVKILPSIGGWTLSGNFPGIAADPIKRETFANACVNLIETYDFDGIDLDWEYPGFAAHNGTPQDKANFNLLLQEVRQAIDAYGATIGKTMTLTAAVGATEERMAEIDWPVVSNYLDIINIMNYDYFGSWDAEANHNAPLFAPAQGNPEFNMAWSIDRLINHYGVEPSKMTAGVAFYGRSAVTNGTPSLFGSITGQVDVTTFPTDQGTPLYYNILLQNSQYDEHWDAVAGVPYMLGNNGLNSFLSYDNEASIELKAQHIIENELRGAIIWEITGDYIETAPGSGVIASTPLVSALNDVFCNYSAGTNSTIENSSETLQIYPNPTTGRCYIQAKEIIQIEILDVQGQQVYHELAPDGINYIDIPSALPDGVYLFKIQSRTNVHTERIVLNR